MFNYQQPDFYHFSQTSLAISTYAAQSMMRDKRQCVLDVFSGCGIVGLDFAQKFEGEIESLYFIELQEVFISYIHKNIKNLNRELDFKTFNQCFRKVDLDLKFDLIMANPPYFDIRETRPSQNINRDLCHRRHDFTMKDFFSFCLDKVHKRGEILFSYPSDNLNIIPGEFESALEIPLGSGESLYKLSLLS